MKIFFTILLLLSLSSAEEVENMLLTSKISFKTSLSDYNKANILEYDENIIIKEIKLDDYVEADILCSQEHMSATQEDSLAEDLEFNNLELDTIITSKGGTITVLSDPLNDYRKADKEVFKDSPASENINQIKESLNNIKKRIIENRIILEDYITAENVVNAEDILIQDELDYYDICISSNLF